jgi:hypothetical protein
LRNSCLRRNTLWDTMKTSGWIPKVKVGCNTRWLDLDYGNSDHACGNCPRYGVYGVCTVVRHSAGQVSILIAG